jgi:hypothetical protein
MRYLTTFICCLLMAATALNCSGIRNNASRIRTRRNDELEAI